MNGALGPRPQWWKASTTVAAVVSATLLCAGIAGAAHVSREQGAAGSGRAEIASLSAESLATTTTTPPTTAAPPATTTTAPAPRPTTTVAAPTGREAIAVEVTPSRPKAGETVRFVVTATQPGNCCSIGLQPGDGGQPALAPGSQSCTAGHGGRQRVEFTYVYNRPGTWNAVARSDAGRACDMTDAGRAVFPGGQWNGTTMPPVTTPALPQILASVTVVVAAGDAPTSSQGPEAPQAEVWLEPGADGQVALSGVIFDRDGWVSRAEVDWGDGSPVTVLAPASACRTGDNGWPVGSPMLVQASLGGGTPTMPPPTHVYAAPGAHKVVVTAVSSGCDGGSQQRVTRTLQR